MSSGLAFKPSHLYLPESAVMLNLYLRALAALLTAAVLSQVQPDLFLSLEWEFSFVPSIVGVRLILELDYLDTLFVRVVRLITSCVLVYSLGYISEYKKKLFFFLIFLFATSIGMLLFSGNLITLFLG